MSQTITNNLDTPPFDKPSDEILAKYAPQDRESIKKLSEQARKERDRAIQELNKQKEKKIIDSQEEYKKRLQEIDEGLKKFYSKPVAVPAIIEGDNGKTEIKHKNKLAFIFVGDTKQAEEDKKNNVNAPKISLVVGGGLESAFNDKVVNVDPRENEIIGVSSQIHLISKVDIDVKGILPNEVSTLFNRSAVKTKADVLEFTANEIVIIRSLGEAYNSQGAKTFTPGGVHIVSGMNSGENKIKEPQPMVLGKNLSDTLLEILTLIADINSTIISMNTDILSLKVSLLAHVHPTAPPGPPTPSLDLAATVAPTIATKTALNISNSYSNLINLELLKTNKLTALSPGRFLSDFNRVN